MHTDTGGVSLKPWLLMRRSERQTPQTLFKEYRKYRDLLLMGMIPLHCPPIPCVLSSSTVAPSIVPCFLPLLPGFGSFLNCSSIPHLSAVFSLFPRLSPCLILWIFVKFGASVEKLTQPLASWALHGKVLNLNFSLSGWQRIFINLILRVRK